MKSRKAGTILVLPAVFTRIAGAAGQFFISSVL
jgi:hypothetical protein